MGPQSDQRSRNSTDHATVGWGPAPVALDEDQRRVAHIRIGMVAVFGACVVFALARLVPELIDDVRTPWWANAIGAVAIALLWAWFRGDPQGRSRIAVHVTAAVALLALLAPVAYGMSSTIWWLSLVAFATALMGTRGEAIIWSLVVLATVVAASLLEPYVLVDNAVGESPAEAIMARTIFAVVLIGIALAFLTLTQRRSAQLAAARAEAERSSQSKSRFLARMSHELRTPLGGVIAMTDLALRSDTLAGDNREQVTTAHRSARVLLRLIEDVLDTARLETQGAVTLDVAPLALHACISEALGPLAVRAEGAGLAFSATAQPGLPLHRLGDATRLTQIALNLVYNAIKFTDHGHVTVRLLGGETPSEVCLVVEDSGCGIAPDQLTAVFEPFVQADTSSKRQRRAGTGLGLAITREIVTRMGGWIELDSVVGEGSRFSVYLDLPLDPDAPEAVGPEDLLAANPDATGLGEVTELDRELNVLVADDDTMNRLVLGRLLQMLGHTFTPAVDGAEAWDLLQGQSFDVVLTDIEMPRMDGIELTRLIRARPLTNGGALPIIVVTGHSGPEWRQRLDDAGATGTLTKPLTLSDLSGALSQALG